MSLNKNFFKTLLELSVRDVLFFFNNILYSQINGVGMGNPLGPTLANAFLCHHEIKWLDNNVPQTLNPSFTEGMLMIPLYYSEILPMLLNFLIT